LARSEVAQLEAQLAADFREHPDAEILLSQPGLGLVLSARVLGESGDDPTRYVNAKARKDYAGNAPVTKRSGKWKMVSRRLARNRLLAMPASFGPIQLSALRPAPVATTTSSELAARPTTRPRARSPTGWSASFTAASGGAA